MASPLHLRHAGGEDGIDQIALFADKSVSESDIKTELGRRFSVRSAAIALKVGGKALRAKLSLEQSPTVDYTFSQGEERVFFQIKDGARFTVTFPKSATIGQAHKFLAEYYFVGPPLSFAVHEDVAQSFPADETRTIDKFVHTKRDRTLFLLVRPTVSFPLRYKPKDCRVATALRCFFPPEAKIGAARLFLSDYFRTKGRRFIITNVRGGLISDNDQDLQLFADEGLIFEHLSSNVFYQGFRFGRGGRSLVTGNVVLDASEEDVRHFVERIHRTARADPPLKKTVISYPADSVEFLGDGMNILILRTSKQDPVRIRFTFDADFDFGDRKLTLDIHDDLTVSDAIAMLNRAQKGKVLGIKARAETSKSRRLDPVLLAGNDYIWPHRTSDLFAVVEQCLTVFFPNNVSREFGFWPDDTVQVLVQKVFDWNRAFADAEFYTATRKIPPTERLTDYRDGLYCTLKNTWVACSLKHRNGTVQNVNVRPWSRILDLRTQAKLDAKFIILAHGEDQPDEQRICALQYRDPQLAFQIESSQVQCHFHIGGERFVLPVTKGMRVSELREQLGIRFIFEMEPALLFYNGLLLVDKDTIPTDRGWEKKLFEVKSEGRIEQLIWCASPDFPLTSFKLPLNATTDDLQAFCKEAAKTEDAGQYNFTVSDTLTFGMVTERLGTIEMGFDQLEAVFQPDISQFQVTMQWAATSGKPKEEQVTCFFSWPGTDRHEEYLTVPRNTTIRELFAIGREQLKLGEYDWLLDPYSKVLFDARACVKNIREPRNLSVVPVIWVDAQSSERPEDNWRFPARLKATVGQYRAELAKTFGNLEFGAVTGEVLEPSFELARLANGHVVSVLAIPEASVGRVHVITLDGQELEFLVDTTRNVGAMKTIIAGRLAVDEATFDLRDQNGMLPDATAIYNTQGHLTCVGGAARLPLAPYPRAADPPAAPPAEKGRGHGKKEGGGDTGPGLDLPPVRRPPNADPGAGAAASGRPKPLTERPRDYERNLDYLDEAFPLIDRRVCARCYNFHNYNFDEALTELRARSPQPGDR
jgi:hypothetical protein